MPLPKRRWERDEFVVPAPSRCRTARQSYRSQRGGNSPHEDKSGFQAAQTPTQTGSMSIFPVAKRQETVLLFSRV